MWPIEPPGGGGAGSGHAACVAACVVACVDGASDKHCLDINHMMNTN